MKITKEQIIITSLFVIAILLLLILPFVGYQSYPLQLLFSHEPSTNFTILTKIRIPRALSAFLVGMALSGSGVCFQALFRNHLATPFTLGISSGASFGAFIYLFLGASFTMLHLPGKTIFSFLGAMLSIIIIYGFSRIKKGFSASSMLLAGVAVNFFFASLILFLQYISSSTDSLAMMRWMMGDLSSCGVRDLQNLLPFISIGSLILLFSGMQLNLISLGDDFAQSRGMNTNIIKMFYFIIVSLMTGAVVSICGPIGFVGMICPHICRLIIGANHRHLVISSLLFGGIFLLSCDTLSRSIISGEVPVGIITSLLGGPLFLLLLIRSKTIV